MAGSEALLAGPFRRWFVIGLLAFLSSIGIVDRVILSMMTVPLKADLGLSDVQIGIAQGVAFAGFYLICAVPFGWAADRFDRRWVLFVGATVWSLAAASGAFVRNFFDLFIARGFVGAGEAVMGPVAFPLIASFVARRHLALAMTIYYLGGTAGNALGQYIGGALLGMMGHGTAVTIGAIGPFAAWRMVFLLTGLPGILVAALIFVAPRDRSPAPAATRIVSTAMFTKFLGSHRRFYGALMIGFGLQQAALFTTVFWNAAFVTRTYGWSAAQIGLVFGTILLVTSPLAVIGNSWVTARLFSRGMADAHLRWQFGTSSIAAIALGFAYLWPTPLAVCLGFGIANLLNGGALVVGPTILQIATPPTFRGRISGVYVVVITLLSVAIGPASVGMLTDHVLGDDRAIGMAIAAVTIPFCLVAAFCYAIGLKPAREIVAETAVLTEPTLQAAVIKSELAPSFLK